MNIYLHTFSELSDAEQLLFAAQIAAETQAKFMAEQKIVPVEPESILQREIGVIALRGNKLAGYVGATNVDESYTQIGTLVVPEHSQGSGIGKQLVAGITQLVIESGQQPFAFCNPSSQSSFKSAGYTPALPCELPPYAQNQFNNQSMIYLRAPRVTDLSAIQGKSETRSRLYPPYSARAPELLTQ